MPLWDAGAGGLDPQVRCLEPGRAQAPGAPTDSSLGPAEAPGKLEQPPAAILGVERVGQADGDVLTRHPAAKHGGVYYSPASGAGSRAFEAVEPGLEAEWVRAPAGSPPAGVALGPSLRGRRISSK